MSAPVMLIANARSGSKAFGVWSSVTVSTGCMATTPSRLRICGTASSRSEIEMPLKSVLKAKRSSYATPSARAAARKRPRSAVSVDGLVPSATGGLSNSTNHRDVHGPETVSGAAAAGALVTANSSSAATSARHRRELPIGFSPLRCPSRGLRGLSRMPARRPSANATRLRANPIASCAGRPAVRREARDRARRAS